MYKFKKLLTTNTIRKFCFTCLILAGIVANTQAQTPCFRAKDNVTRGCAPFSVELVDCSGATTIFYKYGDGSTQTQQNTHTYSEPGLYAVTQYIQKPGQTQADSLQVQNYIEVLPSPQPAFDLKLCSDNAVFLSIPDQNYEEYIINWGDGITQTVSRGAVNIPPHKYNFAPVTITVTGNYDPGNCGGSNAVIVNPIANIIPADIQSVSTLARDPTNGVTQIVFGTNENFEYEVAQKASNENTFTLIKTVVNTAGRVITEKFQNLDTENLSYCYKVTTKDLCGNKVESAVFCNMSLSATAQNNQNTVQWTPYAGSNFQRYVLYRNQNPIQVINDINTLSYIDTAVTCNEQYCYSVEAETGVTSKLIIASNNDCVIAYSEDIPPTITIFNSTVEQDNSIRVFWDIETFPRITEYLVSRTDTTLRLSTTELQAIDVNLDADNNQYFYKIFYTNQCGNSSARSLITSPVLLKASSITAKSVQLQWTHYLNAEQRFSNYELEKLEEDGTVYQTVPLTTDTTYTDTQQDLERQVLRYRVKTYINPATNLVSYSNIVEVKRKFKIFVPNAFTPNGDGLNDTFEPKAIFVKSFNMTVYNRLGKVVYRSQDITQGWDGNFNGKEATSDVYIYTIEMTDLLGNDFKTKGTFTLIR
ncbi:T9SS type B sorting domain-containing protein [uncultured Microscilla sp.]|uniref:T9SS type B sorting domain-containing protein n=1 Tax=uncultured Microscilla sp. TaxID=432653 RepID=UPI00263666B4|nr:T9SS type B sorting domain-containing protein [uncultured Microscilla sp.]